jgi:hypothetical protein
LAGVVVTHLGCCDAVGQTATTHQKGVVESQGLQFSIANIKVVKDTVTVQLLIRNTDSVPQYMMFCIIGSSGASILGLPKLSVATQDIVGLPWTQEAGIGECLSTAKLQDMARIESGAELVVAIPFNDPYHNEISTNNTISFPVDLVVRTAAAPGPMDTPETQKEPGRIHSVNVNFPLEPLSGP